MDEQKLYWIIEFAMRDLNVPHSILNYLLLSLPFPPTPSPPPHIPRLFLLRRLLSLAASHRPLNTLKTLDLLLCSPCPPPASLCHAYASLLFYVSLSPNVSSSDVASSIDRIRNYEFSAEILGAWRGMLTAVDGTRTCAVDRVVSARNKTIWAVKEFVDEEFRAMGLPFLLLAAEEWLRGGKKEDKFNPFKTGIEQEIDTSTRFGTSAKNIKKDLEQNQVDNKKRKISEVNWLNPTRSFAKELEENQEMSKRKCKLNGENDTWTDGVGTSGTGNTRIDVSKINELSFVGSFAKDSEENQDRIKAKSRENYTVKNINDPCTSNSERKNSLTDRNPTAHTFEWNESIDEGRELERSSSPLPRRASHPTTNPNIKSHKRRQVLRWDPQEEAALRKAVKEIGRGNWKEILYHYRDEFVDRTEVDLKDKWRNMTRA